MNKLDNCLQIITNSENETILVGEKFAAVARKGDVFVLNGDLGAGKTHFVKGFAKGLGVNATVTSPTFTILNIYDGKLPVNHFDMYRLAGCDEAEALGFNEYFDHSTLEGVSIVEWAENVEGLIHPPFWIVNIEKVNETSRKISIGRKL